MMQRGTVEDNRHTGRRKNDEIKQKDLEEETKILLKTPFIQPFKMRKSPVVFKKDWWCGRVFCLCVIFTG